MGHIRPLASFSCCRGRSTAGSSPCPTGSLRNRRARRVASAGGMDRSDPYQERAREMARKAGLDPDDRIERPGQRSMPVWCTFRDVARKEHLAREAADAANTIAAEKPQAPNSRTACSRCSASTTTRRLRRCAIACRSATSSPASCERRAGDPAGHQRRKKGAVDCVRPTCAAPRPKARPF